MEGVMTGIPRWQVGWLCPVLCLGAALAQDSSKPRVFITDSQSWEVGGYSAGTSGGGGSVSHGGARPQTAEIIKTFGERCPELKVNNIQEKTDYIVLLDHEGGKSALRHKNKVAVFARVSGDSIVSKSTLSLGGSVQEACEAIIRDWAANGSAMRTAATATVASKIPDPPPVAPPAPAPAPPPAIAEEKGKILVSSTPEGAEVYVDDAFVGNAPATLQLASGKHIVRVALEGYKDWAKEVSVFAGSEVGLKATLEKN
jgi:PEGA domain